MKRRLSLLPALLLLGNLSLPLRSEDDRTEFWKDIHPILKTHCLACHTHGQVKGELRLDTVELMLKGGETGPALVKGSPDKSLLYQVVAGKNELVMPPKQNKVGAVPLSPPELELLRRWILEGAPASAAPLVMSTEPPKWRPLPPGLNPIHSVAITGDGHLAACGRANQIFVYSIGAGGGPLARLVDPALQEGGIADRDYIQSLAFSPDGMLLASGAYRSIRLWRKQAATPQALMETGVPAGAQAASPDGTLLATSGPDGSILCWDPATGKKTLTLPGTPGAAGPVQALAFSPDGKLLASGSADKTIRLFTLPDAAPLSIDAGQSLAALCFAAEGKRLAAAGDDGVIRLYTIPAPGAPGQTPKELKGHGAKITTLRPVGTGKQILSGSLDGSVRLWTADSGKEERKMDHGAPVTDLAVWPDGKRWASAGGTAVKIWKQNGELQLTLKGDRRTQEAQSGAELSVSFQKEEIAYFKSTTQDNDKILAAESENVKKAAARQEALTKEAGPKREATLKATETRSDLEKSLGELPAALKKAGERKESAEKALPEARKTAKGAADQVATAAKQAEDASKQRGRAQQALEALKPDAPAEESTKTREALDAAQKAEDAAKSVLGTAQKSASDSENSLKSAQEAAAAAGKSLTDLTERQKDLESKLKAAEKIVAEGLQAAQALSAAEQNYERLLQVEHRGQEALAASKASLASAEAAQKSAEEALLFAKKAVADSEPPIRRLALSADGRVIATSADEGIVRTWSADTGRGGEDYGPLGAAPSSLYFLPSGALLASVGSRVEGWPRSTAWALERTIGDGGLQSPLLGRVLALAFSPDGRSLVSGGGIPARMGEIKIWDPQTGALRREIREPHSDTVFTVAFSRDGRLLASGGADKLIKLWDPATGAFVRLFEGHTQHVLSLAWKRSGRILFSAGADKVAKIWDLVSGEQLRTIEGFRKEVTAVAWLEAQNELLLASGDGQLRSAKEDGNKNRGYQFGKDYIESATATSDGRLIVAGGGDSVLRIFEAGKDKVALGFDPP